MVLPFTISGSSAIDILNIFAYALLPLYKHQQKNTDRSKFTKTMLKNTNHHIVSATQRNDEEIITKSFSHWTALSVQGKCFYSILSSYFSHHNCAFSFNVNQENPESQVLWVLHASPNWKTEPATRGICFFSRGNLIIHGSNDCQSVRNWNKSEIKPHDISSSNQWVLTVGNLIDY